MIKRIFCLILAMLSLTLTSLFFADAADVTLAETGVSGELYFEVPEDWKNYKTVYCHIWEYGSPTPLAPFQSKKEKCTLLPDGRYSYDVSKVGGLEEGKYYGMLFSVDTLMQTYDAIMTTVCLGDTLYCNSTVYEHPLDSNKTCRAAFFRNQSPSAYGPLMQITSIGNLIGTCLPPDTTASQLFSAFLADKLENARTYSGKTDQKIIDDMAQGLGLSQDSVEKLIKDSGIQVNWTKAESKAPEKDTAIKPSNPGSVSTGQSINVVIFSVIAMLTSVVAIIGITRKRLFT